jgi:hypothetical protein
LHTYIGLNVRREMPSKALALATVPTLPDVM